MSLEVLHLIPCERVEADPENLHRLNIYGLISSIRSIAVPSFPILRAQIVALLVWTGGEGTGDLMLRVTQDSSTTIIFRTRNRRVRFVGNPSAVGGVVFMIRNCVFPTAGLYWIEAVFSGQVIARQRLLVGN